MIAKTLPDGPRHRHVIRHIGRTALAMAFAVGMLTTSAHAAPLKQRPSSAQTRTEHPIAADYSARAGSRLTIFGDRFRASLARDSNTEQPEPLGQIGDDYIIGAGDRLVVRLRGSRNETTELTIDRSGRIALDELNPIMAAGLSLGELRDTLQDAVSSQFLDTRAFVTIDGIRQISVTVTGAVPFPGPLQISSLATPLDALKAAGGIDPMGSLRAVILGSEGGNRSVIDLYDLLLGSNPAANRVTLHAGDRIHVPPIGSTIAIAGAVKRPGVFELSPGKTTISLEEAILFSGGPLRPGAHDIPLSRLGADGLDQHQQLGGNDKPMLENSDLLIWQTPQAAPQGRITLSGHTGRPGIVTLDHAFSLARLLRQPGVILPDNYSWLGLIARRADPTGQVTYISFAPQAVIEGTRDRRLQDRDEVILFPAELFPLAAPILPKDEIVIAETDTEDTGELPLPLDDLRALIGSLELDIGGTVQQPGRYPVADSLSAEQALALAGGVQPGVDVETIAHSRYQQGAMISRADIPADRLGNVMVSAGDVLHVDGDRQALARAVEITGAVLRPGRYAVQAGDRLSDLITRAGGLTEQAFPEGAIFTRQSEKRLEKQRILQAAQELDQVVATMLTRDDKPDRDLIEMSRKLSEELRTALPLGRITVEADPLTLANNPAQDLLLQDGDTVYFPERTLTVRVSGEVLSPAALQFISGKDVASYLKEAGGFTALADKARTFVVTPDGSARPLKVSAWNYDPITVLPGSTIVAPRDPKPFDAIELTANIGNILSQIAVTAASIAVITDNDD